jgi:general secretion pathway protein J
MVRLDTARLRARGFTLIEVMVAVAILAIVTTLVWASFKQTFTTKAKIEGSASRIRTVRIALNRIALDLSMAYLSFNEDRTQPERRTRFVSKHHSDVDELIFTYMGHQRLYQDANESDTTMVQYYGARDRNDSRVQNLMRRETRRLSYQKPEDAPGESDILCEDIETLHFSFYDALKKAWVEEWNTMNADGQPDRLPSKVKVVLSVRDERGQSIPFMTEARVMMTESLDNSPKQSTAGPGGPGAPPVGTSGTSGTTSAPRPSGTTTTPTTPTR